MRENIYRGNFGPEVQAYFPGLAGNVSISSGMLFTDSWLLTVSIKTIAVVAEIGTRSRLASYGSLTPQAAA